MTIEELKNAIDILAGQGNQVDCGGQLKDILQALAMPGFVEVGNYNLARYDCRLLAEIVKAAGNGSLLNLSFGQTTASGSIFARFIAGQFYNNEATAIYYDNNDGEIKHISTEYSADQYEGLAAIQKEADNYEIIPILKVSNGHLASYDGEYVQDFLSVNNKYISPTIVDGKLVSIEVTDIEYFGFNISLEDANKLIGLPCSEL